MINIDSTTIAPYFDDITPSTLDAYLTSIPTDDADAPLLSRMIDALAFDIADLTHNDPASIIDLIDPALDDAAFDALADYLDSDAFDLTPLARLIIDRCRP